MSPKAEVVTGAVVAVLMTVSAAAGVASIAKVLSPVVARRKRIDKEPLLSGSPKAPG
jgi:hypothetical protein